MKVYIENSKVRPRIFEQTLYLPRAYKFTKAFTNSSKEEIELAEAIVKKSEFFFVFIIYYPLKELNNTSSANLNNSFSFLNSLHS